MSSTQEKLPPEHNCHWRAYGQPDGTVVCDECNCAADVNKLIDSAKREELELYVKYIENTDKFYPLYASLDRETAIDECRKFASNYGKHRIAQLEQSEESE